MLVAALVCLGIIWLLVAFRSFRIACAIFGALLGAGLILAGAAFGLLWLIEGGYTGPVSVIVILVGASIMAIFQGRRRLAVERAEYDRRLTSRGDCTYR